jgi:hypothetical protein
MELEIEYDFSIIGINTVVDDSQLAYYLNKYLETNFIRTINDIDIQSKSGKELSFFTHFTYEDTDGMEDWHLIGNKYITENKFFEKENNLSQNLFFHSSQPTQITRYFIPEKKEVNYLLRLDFIDNENKINKLVNIIRSIPVVTTAFSIEYNTLRSKRNLIF